MAKNGFYEKLISKIERVDRKHVENQLQKLIQEKGLLESIFNSILEGVLVTDRDQNIIFANESAGNLLGFKSQDLIQRNLPLYFKSIGLGSLAHLIEGDWGKLILREIRIARPQPRVLKMNVFPLINSQNVYMGLVLTLADVTRHKEKQADEMRSEKLETIDLMAACIAHEIGNPLNAIDIHLQLLDRDIRKLGNHAPASMGESVSILKNEIRRLDQTVRSFLSAARPLRPNLNGMDINFIVKDSLKLISEELAREKIIVKRRLRQGLPKVWADEGQLRQAFHNIIKNSLEAMPAGGRLGISTSYENNFIKIAFDDTGIGISREKLPKIFEPYYTTKATGSGLGLMISYRIIKNHGGRIEVASEEGKGSQFMIYLPVRMKKKIPLLAEPVEPIGEPQ